MEDNGEVKMQPNQTESNGKVKLKLNVKKTITVGLAFMAICMFWQVYDNLMPLMLRELGFKETLRGVVMCLDNVLALVLLPFMGQWSDNLTGKIRNKFGRRMPFIVVGSILAAFCFLLVNFSYNMAKGETVNSGWLAIMMVTTAFLLIAMSLYRTPAVALMPDVTPKEIRSQGNTIINIMGTIGGVIPTLLMSFNVFLTTYEVEENGETVKHLSGNNWLLVGVISALMILATVVLILKVNENKMVEEKRKLLESLGVSEDVETDIKKEKISIREGFAMLDKGQRKSLLFILLSVSLWYFAYNGVTSHFSAFALDVLKLDKFSTALLVGQASAFIFYIPASKLGEKIGRKKTIMLGVTLMILGFGLGSVLIFTVKNLNFLKYVMYPVFVLVGAGWATINVHSFVMSVEMATEKTTGVFTGLYYSFSMAAQIVTPILAGFIMEKIDPRSLLVYATVFSALALITMSCVKHGNAGDTVRKIDVTDNPVAYERDE